MKLIERLVATRNQMEQLEYEYLQGKMDRQMFVDRMKMFMLKIKQEETLVKVAISGTRTRVNNLIGSITPESEMIQCPDQDGKFITREMCLDYSGSHETCSTCREFRTTRKLILDN